MTTARSQQIDLAVTPYYHCVSRCVRRSYLCGFDEKTQQSYEHRRLWLEQRIHRLAQMYCIDICAYAVMSNHYHLVVHVNKQKALALSEQEVMERWSMEHQLDPLLARFQQGGMTDKTSVQVCQGIIETWRERLYSLSWMMRELNMSIAMMANKEDDCTGHFWEGRYKSQALLDKNALLAAMTYVDLNPVRAKAAATPEESEHTSIKLRIEAVKNAQTTPDSLLPFIGNERASDPIGIPFHLNDYLQWVDWIGRRVRSDKLGHIDADLPNILQRLDDSHPQFPDICNQLEQRGCLWVGSQDKLHQAKMQLNRQRIQGIAV